MFKRLFGRSEQPDQSPSSDPRKWTFDQGENVACITVKDIIEHRAPILVVAHDAEDHDWQFLTGGEFQVDDAIVVAMQEIVNIDATVLEIGEMPPGHTATRATRGAAWTIEKSS